MRIATFSHAGRECLGIVQNNRVLALIAGGAAALDVARKAAFAAQNDSKLWLPLTECRLLAPIPRPRKNVFCVGRNYKLHIEEGARARGLAPSYPKVPEFFSKPPTAVIGHDAEVRVGQRVSKQFDYEVELAVVIGTTCRDVRKSDAHSVVFGYTVLNDFTARDLQRDHGEDEARAADALGFQPACQRHLRQHARVLGLP